MRCPLTLPLKRRISPFDTNSSFSFCVKSKVFWRFLCSLLYSCYPLPPLWLIICVFFPLRVCYSATSCLSLTPDSMRNMRACHTMPSCICVLVGLSNSWSCFWKSWAIARWTNSYCSWREKDRDMIRRGMERRKVLQKKQKKTKRGSKWDEGEEEERKGSVNQYRHKNIFYVCSQKHPFIWKYNLFENYEIALTDEHWCNLITFSGKMGSVQHYSLRNYNTSFWH